MDVVNAAPHSAVAPPTTSVAQKAISGDINPHSSLEPRPVMAVPFSMNLTPGDISTNKPRFGPRKREGRQRTMPDILERAPDAISTVTGMSLGEVITMMSTIEPAEEERKGMGMITNNRTEVRFIGDNRDQEECVDRGKGIYKLGFGNGV